MSDPEVLTRFMLIEDLSASLIETLGAVFEIDPEFFAEHLNRSGYNGTDYDDALPPHWETHGMPKAHTSMKWYRPVQQNPKVTQWMAKPSTILDMVSVNRDEDDTESAERVPGSVTWTSTEVDIDGKYIERLHQAVISTNIFRRSWSLSTRPASRTEASGQLASLMVRDIMKEEGWKRNAVPTAWEEKASFFHYVKSAVPISMWL